MVAVVTARVFARDFSASLGRMYDDIRVIGGKVTTTNYCGMLYTPSSPRRRIRICIRIRRRRPPEETRQQRIRQRRQGAVEGRGCAQDRT